MSIASGYQNIIKEAPSKIIIIDCLPNDEKITHRVTAELQANLKGKINLLINECEDENSFVNTILAIQTESMSADNFILHIVSHAEKSGIYLKAVNSYIHWSKFYEMISVINANLNKQLILNMSTCDGIHAIKSNLFGGDDAFFGVIGANRKISTSEAKLINKLFYEAYLAGTSIPDIVRIINLAFDEETIFCATSEGYKQIKSWGLKIPRIKKMFQALMLKRK